MSKEIKAQIIDELQSTLSRCNIGILTDYRGMSNAQMTALRHKLRKLGVEYRVVKNTLVRFAVARAGREDLVDFFNGPVGIAFGFGDVVEPAKMLAEHIAAEKVILSIKGGFLTDTVLTAKDVEVLARLPSREILLSRVVAEMQSPITAVVYCLASPIRSIIGGLQARIKQLEGD
jgi:large subunit ribosomal protein L10